MKLHVITAAYYPTTAIAQDKLWIYLRSAERVGIVPTLIGIGTLLYPGLTNMRINGIADYLKSYRGDATHVLYTDGLDVLFLESLPEIIRRYENFGCPPILISAAEACGNIADVDASPYAGLFDTSIHYRYPGVFYIAEIPAMIELFEWMKGTGTVRELAGDDYEPWLQAWKRGRLPIMDHRREISAVDYRCEIFQDITSHCIIDNGLLKNSYTGTYPAIFHMGGGYVGPKGKDDRLLPWARELGIIDENR